MSKKLVWKIILLITFFLYAGLTLTMAEEPQSFQKRYQTLIDNNSQLSDEERLQKLFEIAWEYRMVTYPEYATYNGYPGQNHRWTDQSLTGINKRKQEKQLPLSVLETIDPGKLNETDQMSYNLYKNKLLENIDGDKFPGELMPINQMGGIQQSAATLLNTMPTNSVEDYENIVARLKGLPRLIEQNIILLEKGIKAGITPPKITLRDVPQQVKNQITDNPADAPMLKAFGNFPDAIPEADGQRLTNEAYATYVNTIIPALDKLYRFLVDDYIPHCRESIAWTDLPNGEEWYAYLVKSYTTTDLTPDEIFEIGMSEIKRIRQEMDEIILSTGFDGDFSAFKDFLRTDPRFFFDNAEDYIREYRDICKRADAGLVKLFRKLPTLPYGVIKIPSYSEKSQTTAYYQSGSLEASRPGYFYVNTYDLKSRPKWEMEALSLHEAVPGHHLQISLAKEIENLPEIRKNSWYTAYGEGWGLYSERLGEEMGFYSDPYSKFGQLTYEMWRAIRLVVDVGMHTKGWSRQKAIDFFMENASKTEHDINVEIDRYIVWPGQALAYKIGEIKIRELRAYASTELGDMFDIRAFHDQLLNDGPLPLDLLEAKIKKWVEKQKRRSKLK